MTDTIRSVLSILFGMLSIATIGINWKIAFKSFFNTNYRASLVFVVGGVSGVAAARLCPMEDVRQLWWLPLIFDWGSGLGLLAAPFLYLRHRTKSRHAGNINPPPR